MMKKSSCRVLTERQVRERETERQRDIQTGVQKQDETNSSSIFSCLYLFRYFSFLLLLQEIMYVVQFLSILVPGLVLVLVDVLLPFLFLILVLVPVLVLVLILDVTLVLVLLLILVSVLALDLVLVIVLLVALISVLALVLVVVQVLILVLVLDLVLVVYLRETDCILLSSIFLLRTSWI